MLSIPAVEAAPRHRRDGRQAIASSLHAMVVAAAAAAIVAIGLAVAGSVVQADRSASVPGDPTASIEVEYVLNHHGDVNWPRDRRISVLP